MVYEYEKENKEAVMINQPKANKELEEVYRKAKAFDEVLKIDSQAIDEDRITGKYESDIETVLSEYMEHADDER